MRDDEGVLPWSPGANLSSDAAMRAFTLAAAAQSMERYVFLVERRVAGQDDSSWIKKTGYPKMIQNDH